MMTPKLMDLVRRQSELSAKVIAKTATAEEEQTLKQITDAIQAATTVKATPSFDDTELAVMKLDEFRSYVEAETAALQETPDANRLALLKYNLAAVQKQTQDGTAETVAVQRFVAKDEDALATLTQRVAELEAKLAEKSVTADDPPAEDPPKKAAVKEDSISAKLAVEALDAYLAKLNEAKAKIESGSLKKDEIYEIFSGSWQLRDVVETYAAIVAKVDEIKPLFDTVKVAVDAVIKDPEDPPADDPPAEDPPKEDPPAEDPPAEDPPKEDPPAEDPPKEDPPAEDPPADGDVTKDDDDDEGWGRDLAEDLDLDKQYKSLKSAENR